MIYYNDNEEYCCSVLRARIADGQLPEGTVDNRSISDVPGKELKQYKQIHLFAGIGGFPLALEWINFGRDRSIITGGFPCQDISTAGKGAGLEGDRSGLWWETLAAISVVRPEFVFLENVSALLTRGLDVVLGSLAPLGYRLEWHCVPARYVGAPHQRDRIWIVGVRDVANTNDEGLQQCIGGTVGDFSTKSGQRRTYGGGILRNDGRMLSAATKSEDVTHTNGRGQSELRKAHNYNGEVPQWNNTGRCGEDVADSECERSQGERPHTGQERRQRSVVRPTRLRHGAGDGQGGWGAQCRLGIHPDGLQSGLDNDCGGWECGVPRVTSGQKDRAKRLKALGNAIVPQCAAYVLNHVLRSAKNDKR